MMRTPRRDTTTVQITHVPSASVPFRNTSLFTWSLFTLFTSKGLFEGVFALYLYLYLYLYSNDRW